MPFSRTVVHTEPHDLAAGLGVTFTGADVSSLGSVWLPINNHHSPANHVVNTAPFTIVRALPRCRQIFLRRCSKAADWEPLSGSSLADRPGN